MLNQLEGKRPARAPWLLTRLLAGIVIFTAASMLWITDAATAADATVNATEQAVAKLDDAGCLTCHGQEKPEIAKPDEDGEMQPLPAIHTRTRSKKACMAR